MPLCLAPNRYALDLSNEVLNIYLGQGAAKILKWKLEVKKITDSDHARLNRQIIFRPLTFDLRFFL